MLMTLTTQNSNCYIQSVNDFWGAKLDFLYYNTDKIFTVNWEIFTSAKFRKMGHICLIREFMN